MTTNGIVAHTSWSNAICKLCCAIRLGSEFRLGSGLGQEFAKFPNCTAQLANCMAPQIVHSIIIVYNINVTNQKQ